MCVTTTQQKNAMHIVGNIHALSMYAFCDMGLVFTKQIKQTPAPHTAFKTRRMYACLWRWLAGSDT
jgi:hypothetical protein